MQTVPKSVRAIHVLATPWQPRGKHLNPPAPLLEEENASRGHVLSLRHCGPLLFLPMPPGLYVKEIRKREREGGREGRYRGNNGTQWAGESGFFLAFAIALVKFCLFGSRTLTFSRHTQGMYRMIRRVRVEIIQNLHVETNRKYRRSNFKFLFFLLQLYKNLLPRIQRYNARLEGRKDLAIIIQQTRKKYRITDFFLTRQNFPNTDLFVRIPEYFSEPNLPRNAVTRLSRNEMHHPFGRKTLAERTEAEV